MDKNAVLRLIHALRREIEEISLQAQVFIEGGISIGGPRYDDPDIGGHQALDLAVYIVRFSGWPTSAADPETFAGAEVPLSSPLLTPLRDHTVSVKLSEISHLPETICRLAAKVLDGQRFKVRLVQTDQELVEAFNEHSNLYHWRLDDVGDWRIPRIFELEAWNQHGVVKIYLGNDILEGIFTDDIVDRFQTAVAPK